MSPADASLAAAASFRVVTWNVHGGVGRDGRCDLERVAEALLALRPDVAALQEIDGRTHLGRRPRAFERIAEALGGHVVEARTTGRGDKAYGHLLWSARPFARAAVLRLPGGRLEPRAVIDAETPTPAGLMRILASHFSLGAADRRSQAAYVAERCAGTDRPTIALGDFNDWRLDKGPVHGALGAVLPELATLRTFPARRPMFRLDRIYASRALHLHGVDVGREAGALSDHLPLVADFRVNPLFEAP
ncbi:endonuclease/exonuclease/phosphatase family protein [Aureimonas psammosilenae]|uniref:endonuclease/exonuclease/phosphatase family protein n=1 Tax=Aureimonas psammosilenae TaxID=2495496 RepID=UPI001260AC62|nr:endonuclease/exonuclease/phosphatase family protein [Aureimonas psammosilenae]